MISLKNISSGYRGINILDHLSYDIHNGKLISIVGVNGSGKSTLLKTILGIISLTNGEIIIDKKDINSLKRIEIAKKISYFSQEKIIPDMTVEQLVLLGRFPHIKFPKKYSSKDKEIANKAMMEFDILEYANTSLNELSGGMRQKAYLAMALTQDTDYILLDEPTAFLDVSHQISLMKSLKKLTEKGKTIIMVMHDLPIAFEFSDEIAILSDKKIVLNGTPKDVYKSKEIMKIFKVELKYLINENKYIVI